MTSPRFTAACALAALLCQPLDGLSAGRSENWVTKQGEKFRAAAVDVLGPYAVFVTAQKGGRKVMLGQLAEEDCVRFGRGIVATPPRAPRWSHASSDLTREVLNNVRRLEGGEFVEPDFDRLPEPEFLMLVFLSAGNKRSAEVVRELIPEYERVRGRFGGLSEAIFIGVDHSESDHDQMARQLQMPWLIEDSRRGGSLREARTWMSERAPALMIVTRTGVPIASSRCKTKSEVDQAVLDLEAMLSLMRPGDKRAWPDRLYFYRTVRLETFRTGRADPLVVGHQLDLDALRVAGIRALDATMRVSADGKVVSALVHPTAGVTVEFGHTLGQALRQSAVVPAVEDGEFVEGEFQLHLEF